MTGNSVIPIWVDCDPGHDDAVAILLSCFHPSIRLLGISASYGNASPENTLYNTLSLLTAFGKQDEVPVYKGAQRPWVRDVAYAPDIHGETGLDGTTLLPKPKRSFVDADYIKAMENAILANGGNIALVSTGTLTSIATLFKEKPYLKEQVRYISIMGGGLHAGNRNDNDSAEFNIWADPDAADFILNDEDIKHKCILSPLDLTHTCIATEYIDKTILGDGSCKLRKLFYELFLFFAKTYKNKQGFEAGPPVHDPVTLMPLLYLYGHISNDILRFKYGRFDLSIDKNQDSINYGRTIVTQEYPSDSNFGLMVGLQINVDFFWNQVLNAIDVAENYPGSL
ncbi:trifunctional uridine nucleosidase/nicotinamide riboside hydrolase/nicotinic acid riboside hydrolase [Kluyveromyces lactis]|uniref:KLLA0C06721p n=1 Tax=Kluyveromyces lactis (strain ATCC 8585 / CBS 2359 / DSM 70799 / NBRC 1267 / NRRL Y-1140 / WM37) TaxID=284590 RepID=Q6CU92_KLULA|nr:uncharacterized protein KLLA0_C06721g [Kluyveromyces lactis]CAH01348.1 KLLA0C06721p [Kluyveromyces lactis]|eukprot:XP_452497.1 uncharacterized protein KLLA0_C06721g [Kluyveromyces lactis]